MVNWEHVSTIGAGGSTGAEGGRYGFSSMSAFYLMTSRGNGKEKDRKMTTEKWGGPFAVEVRFAARSFSFCQHFSVVHRMHYRASGSR
jgi:hypothetical protein